MAQLTTHISKIIYLDESAFADITGKTFNSNGTVMNKVQSFNATNDQNIIYDKGIGEGRSYTEAVFGNYTCTATLDFNVTDFDFFKFNIGPKTGSGTTGSPYVLTESDSVGYTASDIETFSLAVSRELGATDEVLVYSGGIINSFTLNGTVGGLLTASCDMIFKKPTPGTTSYTTSLSSAKPYVVNTIDLQWNSSSVANVQNFSITCNGNMKEERGINSRFITGYTPGDRVYTFTFTAIYKPALVSTLDVDFFGDATGPIDELAPVERDFDLVMSEGDSSGDRKFQIYFENASLTPLTAPINVGDGIVQRTYAGTMRTGGNTLAPFKWWTV